MSNQPRVGKGVPNAGEWTTAERSDSGVSLSVAAEAEFWSDCPVCGAPIDYCQGHGSDEAAANTWDNHDDDDHTGCHPNASCRVELNRRYLRDSERPSYGDRSPWGTIDGTEWTGDGITAVFTARHGGLKVDEEANAVIPPALRKRSGWYEEDCEQQIVWMYHPESVPNFDKRDAESVLQARREALKSVEHYFPEEAARAKRLGQIPAELLDGTAQPE